MTVRRAVPDDADAIERVRTDTWRDAYRGLLPGAVLDRLGEVCAIYVRPSHQGHGHGSRLFRAGLAECLERGWRGVLVWVLRENEPARRFYERMGDRQLRGRDETRVIEGVTVTEAAYAWDDVTEAASPR